MWKNLLATFTKNVVSTSPAGKVDYTDLLKLVKNGLISGLSAGLLAVLAYIGANVEHVNFGDIAPYVLPLIPAFHIGIDFLVRLVRDNTKVE